MNTEWVNTFLEIVKYGSINLAAGEMFLSQSTISTRLNLLEEELGYKLIQRSKGQRSIRLTDEGRAFLPIAKRLSQIQKEAFDIRYHPHIDLHIAAIDSYNRSFLSHLYKKMGTPMTWMCAIAKNQYLDFVRKYGKNRNTDFGEVENYVSEGMANVSDDASHVENKMILEYAFSILGEQERTIVILHMINGLKHREIAELTGLPLSTVLSKYNRSLKKMKNSIMY